MTASISRGRLRLASAAACALTLLLLAVGSASAQEATTLTVRVGVVPVGDAGRFDLSIDGVTLAAAVGDGGDTGAQPVLPGSFVVAQSAAAGTSLAAYSTTVTCVDGDEVLVAAAPLTATSVNVARGHAVVCTFVNALLPVAPPAPVVAPPIAAKPILLPPAFVRGSAILRGVEGCTPRSTVVTRVIARNIARLVFIRDGRVVRRVATPSFSWRTYSLETSLPAGDYTAHVVRVRAIFVNGATPPTKAMTHRFGHCRVSAVAG